MPLYDKAADQVLDLYLSIKHSLYQFALLQSRETEIYMLYTNTSSSKVFYPWHLLRVSTRSCSSIHDERAQ
jgi:hypothetical protein